MSSSQQAATRWDQRPDYLATIRRVPGYGDPTSYGTIKPGLSFVIWIVNILTAVPRPVGHSPWDVTDFLVG